MDGDGDLDIVAGGGRALFIYENGGKAGVWTRYGNLDNTGEIGANGAVLYDVDRDGDMDVVCAKYKKDLGWWENPGPPLRNTKWKFHKISSEGWYLHDLVRADLDQDGVAEEFVANLNEGYWKANLKIKWFQPGENPTSIWESHLIGPIRNEGDPHGHAGLDVGDVDRDGHVDLAYSNGWNEAPDEPTETWTWHKVADIYGISNSLLRDMDADGDLDLIMSAGHHGKGIYWFSAPVDPLTGKWVKNTIDAKILHPESLAVLDLDGDGDLDVVTSDLDFDRWEKEVHNIYIFENQGNSISWKKQNIAPRSYPSHLLQMVDLNQDGRMDIISEATGYPVVTYYENITPNSASDRR
jgi:hypothetical protein